MRHEFGTGVGVLAAALALGFIADAAAAGSQIALLVPPSLAQNSSEGGGFSTLKVVPFHNALAVHTFSDREKKYVFIYCTDPGKIKTIAVTLSYGTRSPDKIIIDALPNRVAAADLAVKTLDGRIEPFVTSHRSARTYRTSAGEYKTDIVLQFADPEFSKLANARVFSATEGGFDIARLLSFELVGSRGLFETAMRSCVR